MGGREKDAELFPKQFTKPKHTMKTLPNQFDYQSHTLTLIERTESVGLYQTTRQGESLVGYIVAKIGKRQGGTRTFPNGKTATFTAGEFLPSENEFGRSAWFFRDQKEAHNQFLEVRDRANAAFQGSSHTLTRAEPLDAEINR